MVKKLREIDESRVKAQRSKPCLITGCEIGGRVIGRMGSMELTYCGKHRKYGERVLNFLIRSVFGEKLKVFLKESKDDLFMENNPCLCDDCYSKLANYINQNISKLDEVEEWHDKLEGKKK